MKIILNSYQVTRLGIDQRGNFMDYIFMIYPPSIVIVIMSDSSSVYVSRNRLSTRLGNVDRITASIVANLNGWSDSTEKRRSSSLYLILIERTSAIFLPHKDTHATHATMEE